MTRSRVLIVRHGESEWNAIGRWQGQADPPLSERGERQAIDAAASIRRIGHLDVVVTSNLRRARRTGELIAEVAGLELGPALPDLAERSAGEWEGLTRAEINERFPGDLDEHRRPQGYESDDSILLRSRRALLSLHDTVGGRNVLVVCHGGVIGTLERTDGSAWRRLDNLEGRWFDVGSTSIVPVGERLSLASDVGRVDAIVDRDAV